MAPHPFLLRGDCTYAYGPCAPSVRMPLPLVSIRPPLPRISILRVSNLHA